jgi:hypothetical protein
MGICLGYSSQLNFINDGGWGSGYFSLTQKMDLLLFELGQFLLGKGLVRVQG